MPQNMEIPFAKDGESKIDLFKKRQIRKTFHHSEWWFSVTDVAEALLDVADGTDYLKKLRQRDEGLREGWGQIVTPLPFATAGGMQNINFINIEGIFRLMQSVPSPKADDFKKWLAKVGFERIQELQNPELAIKRAVVYFKAKGYTDEWIEARIQNKLSREQLEDEWDKRGIKEPRHYGLLTDAIAVGTFGVHIRDHMAIKGLKPHHNLRDNMTPIELTLTTLGEQATREIAKTSDAKGLTQNLDAAQKGGKIAGTARFQIEQETKRSVVSRENFLTERQRKNATLPGGVKDVMERVVKVPKKEKGSK